MTDTSSLQEPSAPPVDAYDAERATSALKSSVRRLRLWLALLTVFMVLAVASMCGLAVLTIGPGWILNEQVPEVDVAGTKADFKNALGDRLDTLVVRVVTMEYSGVPFPYSIIDGGGGGGEQSIYVEYTLKGSDVLIADIAGSAYGPDPATSGMLPTHGTIASRMSEEQFDRLLEAYATQTNSPLGAVRRYNDPGVMMEPGTIPESVLIGDEEYQSKELWSAMEGRVLKGDTVNMDSPAAYSRKAFVFHEDPKTGEFTYLGTEPAEPIW